MISSQWELQILEYDSSFALFETNDGGCSHNIFTCLFSIHNKISLSHHKQVCLMRLYFETYFSHHQAAQMIMPCIFTENMQIWTEPIELPDLDG